MWYPFLQAHDGKGYKKPCYDYFMDPLTTKQASEILGVTPQRVLAALRS
jgi:hypothetical protein